MRPAHSLFSVNLTQQPIVMIHNVRPYTFEVHTPISTPLHYVTLEWRLKLLFLAVLQLLMFTPGLSNLNRKHHIGELLKRAEVFA